MPKRGNFEPKEVTLKIKIGVKIGVYTFRFSFVSVSIVFICIMHVKHKFDIFTMCLMICKRTPATYLEICDSVAMIAEVPFSDSLVIQWLNH